MAPIAPLCNIQFLYSHKGPSGIFCITSHAVLRRRIIATENDRNVVPFTYLLPQSLNCGLILT